jgi:hypothetical protein
MLSLLAACLLTDGDSFHKKAGSSDESNTNGTDTGTEERLNMCTNSLGSYRSSQTRLSCEDQCMALGVDASTCEDYCDTDVDTDIDTDIDDSIPQYGVEQIETDFFNSIRILSIEEKDENTISIYFIMIDENGIPIEYYTNDEIIIEQSNDGVTYSPLSMKSIGKISEIGEDINIGFSSVIDYSSSIYRNDLLIMNDALELFYSNVTIGYESEVIKFSSCVYVSQEYTSNYEELVSTIQYRSFARGNTALYDGIAKGLIDTNEKENKIKFVMPITDGLDNSSYHTLSDTLDKAVKFNIPLFVLGVSGANMDVLKSLSKESGGYYFYVPTFLLTDEIMSYLSVALNSVNELSLTPLEGGTTGERSIRLTFRGQSFSRTF